MAFAYTENLTLRAYRDSDLDLLHALWNDPQVQRTGTNEYVAPRGPKWARDTLPAQIESSILHVIIEATNPDSHEPEAPGEGHDSGTAAPGAEADKSDKFVGYCLLQMPNPKNRDANLAIALHPRWWGRGFGTEVMRWIVDYGFENCALNRVSLAVMDGNERAIRLYQKLGFVEEGRKRECNWSENRWKDFIIMGMLRREWEAQRGSRD